MTVILYKKSEVDFRHPSADGKICRNCVHYQSATRFRWHFCRIVLGAVEPGDCCSKFEYVI